MERGKMSSTGRGGKSKAPQHPQDIFALGSKSTVVVSRDSEKRNIHKPSTSGNYPICNTILLNIKIKYLLQ